MKLGGAIITLAGLIILVAWSSRRWGPPRVYVGRTAALWVVTATLAVIVLRVMID